MPVHAVRTTKRRASAPAGRWFIRLASDTDGMIRGTGTGRHALWIEVDQFVLHGRNHGRTLQAQSIGRAMTGGIVARFRKKPDIATPYLFKANATAVPLEARVEHVVAGKTTLSFNLRSAGITGLRILEGPAEEIELLVFGVELSDH